MGRRRLEGEDWPGLLKALLLDPSHATKMRLHGRVVTLITDLLGLREKTGLVGRISHPGYSSGCPVPATTMRMVFLAPIAGNLNGSKGTDGTSS